MFAVVTCGFLQHGGETYDCGPLEELDDKIQLVKDVRQKAHSYDVNTLGGTERRKHPTH